MIRSILRALAVVSLATASLVNAQPNAGKPIRLICPFPPAGAVDIASRAIANELSKILGQPVTVDNRPGAGGNIGSAEAVRSAPDGRTLLMTTSGINAINPALYAKMPFDPIKDLEPVVALVSLSNVLAVHPSLPSKSVKELIEYAKSRPGTLNYGASGVGSSGHLRGEPGGPVCRSGIHSGTGPVVSDGSLAARRIRVDWQLDY